MMFSTEYIGPLMFTNAQEAEIAAELRVEPAEGVENRLAIGVYDNEEGENLGTAELTEAQARELLGALKRWLTR